MKKKILIPVITAAIMGFAAIGASARNLDMYVNNHHVVRDIQTVGRFDMLPVLDIAGELGFNCSFDGTTIKLYNDSRSYKFTMGKAAAYDQNGKWYGLDVVPQIINGSVRIPYKFFCDAMGLSYTWDDVTSTIFLGSDRTYNWLINTKEYKQATEPQDIFNTLSSGRIKDLNVFLSNFSEAGFEYYDCDNIDASSLISFAFIHDLINNYENIKYSNSNMGISAWRVDEILNRYLGKTISKRSVQHWQYDGSYYWTLGATGETYSRFSIAVSYIDLKNGTYKVNCNNYCWNGYGLMDFADPEWYWYSDWEVLNNSEFKKMSSSVAIIKPVVYNGKNTWQLLSLNTY